MADDRYKLDLTAEQLQELTEEHTKAQAKIKSLKDGLTAICPGLELEKLSPKERDRWMNLREAMIQAEIDYQIKIEDLCKKYLLEHLQSLGDDPIAITKDATDRIRYLHSSGAEQDLIESFMLSNYVPLFEDRNEAEKTIKILIRSVVDGVLTDGTGILIRQKPLPPLKGYAVMNTKTVKVMTTKDPTPFSNKALLDAKLLLSRDDVNSTFFGYAIQQDGKNTRSKKPPVVTYTVFDFQGSPDLLTSRGKRFTPFDFAVYTAVWNKFKQHKLVGSGPLLITPNEIWRTMNGFDVPGATAKYKPSENQIEEIKASMQRWAYTRIRMNLNAEILNNFIDVRNPDDRIKSGILDSQLLDADIAIFTSSKGHTLTGYRIIRNPILGEYAERKGQVLNIPYGMMKFGKSGSVEIGHYLIQRIQSMYNGYADSNRILFSALYEKGGITAPEFRVIGTGNEKADQTQIRRHAKRDREKVIEILTGWIPDFILGFSLIAKDESKISPQDLKKSKKQLIGVEIDLDPEKIKNPKKRFARLTEQRKNPDSDSSR